MECQFARLVHGAAAPLYAKPDFLDGSRKPFIPIDRHQAQPPKLQGDWDAIAEEIKGLKAVNVDLK